MKNRRDGNRNEKAARHRPPTAVSAAVAYTCSNPTPYAPRVVPRDLDGWNIGGLGCLFVSIAGIAALSPRRHVGTAASGRCEGPGAAHGLRRAMSAGRRCARYATQTDSESPDLGPRHSGHARRRVARLGTSPLRGLLPVMGMSEIGLRCSALGFSCANAKKALQRRRAGSPSKRPAELAEGPSGSHDFTSRTSISNHSEYHHEYECAQDVRSFQPSSRQRRRGSKREVAGNHRCYVGDRRLGPR